MEHHRTERAALVAALRRAGPGAGTLCAGWRTEHLAAHVVLRESTVLTAAGIVVPRLHDRTERAIRRLGDRSTTPAAWAGLLHRVADGPPWWNPLRWAGDGPQLAEMFVHTEDVRRAVEGVRTDPRPQAPDLREALWRAVARAARLATRGCPLPTDLCRPDGRAVALGTRRGADEPARVVVEGEPGELLLWVFDRSRVARVRLEGAPDDLERLARFREPAPV